MFIVLVTLANTVILNNGIWRFQNIASPASIFLRPMVPETSGIFKVTTFQIKPAVPISESVGERFCVQFCVQGAPNMPLKQFLLRARGESQDTLSDFRVGPWAFGFRLVCRNAMFLSWRTGASACRCKMSQFSLFWFPIAFQPLRRWSTGRSKVRWPLSASWNFRHDFQNKRFQRFKSLKR